VATGQVTLAHLQRLSEPRRHTDYAHCDQKGGKCIEQFAALMYALFAMRREINVDHALVVDRFNDNPQEMIIISIQRRYLC